jgi:hypothetical protein
MVEQRSDGYLDRRALLGRRLGMDLDVDAVQPRRESRT